MALAKNSLSYRALKLPAKKRMHLAALLLESMDHALEADPSLLVELKKRAADLRSGKVQGLTTEQAYGFSL